MTAFKAASPGKEFIALMAACMSIVAISIDAMLPALTIIGEDLGTTHPNQSQLIISAIFLGMALGQLLCGPLSDAWGRKRLLYFSLLFYLSGTLVCTFADSITVMLCGRLLQGLGVAGPYVSTISIVRDRFSGRAMAQVMSLVMMIFIMVPVVAPSLGQLVLYLASWRFIFVLFFVYALAIVIWVSIRLPETLPPANRIPFSLANIAAGAKKVLGHRATVCYTLAAGCLFGSLLGYLNSSLQIFHSIYNVGDQFALYFGGLALTLGVSSLLNSRLVQHFGMRTICIRALFTMLIASVVLLSLQVLTSPALWMFVTFGAVQFFCLGLLFGNVNALAMEPMGDNAGIAAAIIGSVSSVVSILAGTLVGQLFNGTLYPLITGFLILGLAAMAALLLARTAGGPSSDTAEAASGGGGSHISGTRI